jgi:hypothetical protein
MSRSGQIANGGAATVISPEGDVRLVFKLDKSWIVRPSSPFTSQSSNQNQSNIDRFTPFNPDLSDIKLSINLIVDGVTTTYSIDHQTWPTAHTHNGQIHIFDQTSPIRLASIHVGGDNLDLEERDPEDDVEGVVWKAKHLIGKQWEEDELETPKPRGVSQEHPQGDLASASIADIKQKVTSKFRQADQIVARRGTIQKRKRRMSYLDEEDRSTESDKYISDVDDVEPLPSIKSLFDPSQAEMDRPGRRVSKIEPMPSPERNQGQQVSNDRRDVYVYCPDGPLMFSAKPSTKGRKIMEVVARAMGVPMGSFRLILSSSYERLYWDQTVHEMGLKEFGDMAGFETEPIIVDVIIEQTGGKPVIYLYPPQPMSVGVTLSLCPQCESVAQFPLQRTLTTTGAISAVHPPTPVLKPELTTDGWERVGWTVNTEIDGTMVDTATGLEVSYLFWEGEWSSSYNSVRCSSLS